MDWQVIESVRETMRVFRKEYDEISHVSTPNSKAAIKFYGSVEYTGIYSRHGRHVVVAAPYRSDNTRASTQWTLSASSYVLTFDI
jgi:hypothetical protein